MKQQSSWTIASMLAGWGIILEKRLSDKNNSLSRMRLQSRRLVKQFMKRKGRKTRKQRGGEDECKMYKSKMEILKQMIDRKLQFLSIDSIRFLMKPEIDLKKCSAEYFPDLKEKLLNYPIRGRDANLSGKFDNESLHLLFMDQNLKNAPASFYEFFGFKLNKDCSIEELMTLKDPMESCLESSLSKVRGSCGVPSFFTKENDYSEDTREKYIELFDAIEAKLLVDSDPKYFDLVLGATTEKHSNFSNTKNSYTLTMSGETNSKLLSFESILTEIKSADTLKNKKHNLKHTFPLHYSNRPNSKAILDKLINMNHRGIKVRITNSICGSCFPSFYYLVKNGIEYSTAPEQGLGRQNTNEIRRCFKP